MRKVLLVAAAGFPAYIGVSILMYWWDPRLLRTSNSVLNAATLVMLVVSMVWSWHTYRLGSRHFDKGEAAYKKAVILRIQHLHGCYHAEEIREGYISLTCQCGENIGVMPVGDPDVQLMERHVNREIDKLAAYTEAKMSAG
jgi:hypothetical protein